MDKVGSQNRCALVLWYTRKYPTLDAQANAYAACWVRVVENAISRRHVNHGVLPIDEEKIIRMLTTGNAKIAKGA
jgi:hypothetical protein